MSVKKLSQVNKEPVLPVIDVQHEFVPVEEQLKETAWLAWLKLCKEREKEEKQEEIRKVPKTGA